MCVFVCTYVYSHTVFMYYSTQPPPDSVIMALYNTRVCKHTQTDMYVLQTRSHTTCHFYRLAQKHDSRQIIGPRLNPSNSSQVEEDFCSLLNDAPQVTLLKTSRNTQHPVTSRNFLSQAVGERLCP